MPGYSYGATAGTVNAETIKLRAEIKKAQAAYDELAKTYKQAIAANRKITRALEVKSEECATLKNQLAELEANGPKNDDRLAELEATTATQAEEIKKHKKTVKDLKKQIETVTGENITLQEQLDEMPAPVAEIVTFEGYLTPGALEKIQELVA